jgi:hypothetical protein
MKNFFSGLLKLFQKVKNIAMLRNSEVPEGVDEDYYNYVKEAAKAQDMRLVLNGAPQNAGVIMEFMFKSSENKMRIFTTELSEKVYNRVNVVDAARAFLENNKEARLDIIHEKPLNESSFTREIIAKFPEQIDVRKLPATKADDYLYNFSVGDEKNYRFENDKENFSAYIQFGNKEEGEALNRRFDEIASHCQSVN